MSDIKKQTKIEMKLMTTKIRLNQFIDDLEKMIDNAYSMEKRYDNCHQYDLSYLYLSERALIKRILKQVSLIAANLEKNENGDENEN